MHSVDRLGVETAAMLHCPFQFWGGGALAAWLDLCARVDLLPVPALPVYVAGVSSLLLADGLHVECLSFFYRTLLRVLRSVGAVASALGVFEGWQRVMWLREGKRENWFLLRASFLAGTQRLTSCFLAVATIAP